MALEYLSVDGSSMSCVGFSYLPFDMIKSIEELHVSASQLDQSFFERLVPRMPLLHMLTVCADKDEYPYLDMERIVGITDLMQLKSLTLEGLALNLDILNYFDKNLSMVRESAEQKRERERGRAALEGQWIAEREQKLKKHERKEESRKRGEEKAIQEIEKKIQVATDQMAALRKKGMQDGEPRMEELQQQWKKLGEEKERYKLRMAENREKRLAELHRELSEDNNSQEDLRGQWRVEDVNGERQEYPLFSPTAGSIAAYNLTSLTLTGLSAEELTQLTVLGQVVKALTLLDVIGPAAPYGDAIAQTFTALEYLGVCRVKELSDGTEKSWKEVMQAISSRIPSIRRIHLCGIEALMPGVMLPVPQEMQGGRCDIECPSCKGGDQRLAASSSSTFSFVGDNAIQVAREDLFNDLLDREEEERVMWCGCPQCKAQLTRWSRKAEGRYGDEDDDSWGEELDCGKSSRRDQFERHGHKIKNRDIMYGHKIIMKKER